MNPLLTIGGVLLALYMAIVALMLVARARKWQPTPIKPIWASLAVIAALSIAGVLCSIVAEDIHVLFWSLAAVPAIIVFVGCWGWAGKPRTKLSPIQYAFARDWPLKVYLAVWAILGVVIVISECQPSLSMLSDWVFCVLFIVSLLLAPALFAFLSIPFAFLLLPPLYSLGDRMAGAPFRVGDQVRILIGPHRGRVVEIYDVWDCRREIRVNLGAASASMVRDVYSFTQVCREGAE